MSLVLGSDHTNEGRQLTRPLWDVAFAIWQDTVCYVCTVYNIRGALQLAIDSSIACRRADGPYIFKTSFSTDMVFKAVEKVYSSLLSNS